MVTKTDSGLIVHDGGTIKDVLDTAKPIANYTALRAYTGSASQIRITSTGIAGFFYRDDSDTTSVDNGGTIIVSSNGKRWKRSLSDEINVLWFGADRTGTSSSVVSVNAALAAANNSTGSIVVYFPNGFYDLKAGITTKITKNDITVQGDTTRILCETGKIFWFDTGSLIYRTAVKGFYFSYPSVPVDINAVPVYMYKCLYFSLDEIKVAYAPAVLYLGSCSNGVINGIAGITANVAKNAIHLNSCVVTSLDNVYLINDAGLQPTDPAAPYANPPVAGNVFIRVDGQTTDTLFFKSGVLCNRYHRGFYATCGVGTSLLNIWMNSCVFDYCYDKGVFIENLGSSTADIRMVDLYIQAMQGVGIHIKTTGGLTNNTYIVRPMIGLCGIHGIYLESPAPYTNNYNTVIEDPYLYGNNRLNSGGIDIYCVRSRVYISGGRVGINAFPFMGISLQATYGVFFDACDEYTVTGIESGGSAGSYAFTNNPTTDYRTRLVHDNKTARAYSVLTKPDYETTTLTTVVSGELYTNTTPYKLYVSVYGSAASGAATIEVNDQQYSTRSEWSGVLNPGDTLKVTTGITCNRRISRLP